MVVVSIFSSWLLCSWLFLVVSSVFGGLSVDQNNDSSTSWLVLVVLCLVCVVVAGMFVGMVYLAVGYLGLGLCCLVSRFLVFGGRVSGLFVHGPV